MFCGMLQSVAISKDPVVFIWRTKQFTDIFRNGTPVTLFRIFFITTKKSVENPDRVAGVVAKIRTREIPKKNTNFKHS
jgi:hypothetical protein